ncbi:MAG: hypothetical protein COA42_13840 [Alteromonadaceae bacterium]|nr:MAG: hypothetical protein COA42_13840 [Alteromonadaceae bacterium]
MNLSVINNSSSYNSAVTQSTLSADHKKNSPLFQDAMARAEFSNRQEPTGAQLSDKVKEDLQRLALPKWLDEYRAEGPIVESYFEESKEIQSQMKTRFGGNGEQFTKENPAPLEWRKKVFEFSENYSSRQQMRARDAWNTEFKQEIIEYGRIGSQAMQRAYHANNITSEEYYENVKLLDPVKDEQVHQSYREFLMGNPRAVQLMELLGVKALG